MNTYKELEEYKSFLNENGGNQERHQQSESLFDCLNTYFKFDKGDWYWCPEHKGTDRQFECHKSITSEMVINKIKHLL